ncbi:MAG: hypothetical protein FWG53_05340 [Clostridiales bacterium]|nr:hypothetical protein [Clostridiales bacterium]
MQLFIVAKRPFNKVVKFVGKMIRTAKAAGIIPIVDIRNCWQGGACCYPSYLPVRMSPRIGR